MLTSRRRVPKDEAGTSLVELLVVLGIMTILGGMIVTAMITGTNAARVTSARATSLQELELATQRVVRDLRVAEELILSADDDFDSEISAVVRRGGETSTVRFAVVQTDVDGPKQLIREDTGFALIARLDNSEDGVDVPVFRYLDQLGRAIDCSTATECAQRYVGAAQVELTFVREIPGREPVRTQTRLNVRNIRYGGA